jgi:homocysteine S-methyltransferase
MNHYPERSRRFLERIRETTLVGDGAMGTLLHSRGVALDANIEHLNLVQPERVARVHADYIAAGADLLETNTFGANRLRLGTIGLEAKVRRINLEGARLARGAAGEERFVAGSVGPLLRPRGDAKELGSDEKSRILREQMEALAEGGVDLFLLETFACLDDLKLGVGIAAELGLPAVAQMAFLEAGYSREGISAERAATELSDAGAVVIGANCGSGPKGLLQVIPRMAAVVATPLSAFPNAGAPEYVDGRYLYLATPDYFARRGVELAAAGAALVGGCCGIAPEHIAALRRALTEQPPGRARAASRRQAPELKASRPQPRKTFLDGWGQRPIITVELDPPRGLDVTTTLERARALAAAGIDAISLAENPLARIRLGNLALAKSIQDEIGIEVIAHVTCRDRNLIGLHSELMGAHLLGLRTILAVTGDPVAVGDEVGATSVFDLNSVGLLKLLQGLNRGESSYGAPLSGQTDFLLGAAFNPNLTRIDGQLAKLEKKLAAGAAFVQTQPVYARENLDRLLERTAAYQVPVLVGILPLVSERNAEFLHNEVPGISVPDEIRRRMRGKSGDEGAREGLAIAGELVAHGRGRVGGYYLMPPFGRIDLALQLAATIRRLSGA